MAKVVRTLKIIAMNNGTVGQIKPFTLEKCPTTSLGHIQADCVKKKLYAW